MAADAVFFGAHPDDVELTSGGLAARLAQQGFEVVVADLTRGEAGTRGSAIEREREAVDAAHALGVARRVNLGLPDLGLDRSDREQLRTVAQLLREERPALVVAPDDDDLHPDHVEASRLVARASYLSGLSRFEASGERHRPSRVLFSLYRTTRPPHLVVDVTDVWERRMAALRTHQSQLSGAGPETYLTHPDFLPEVESRARVYGAAIGVRYGEGYRVRGPVPIAEPSCLMPASREGSKG